MRVLPGDPADQSDGAHGYEYYPATYGRDDRRIPGEMGRHALEDAPHSAVHLHAHCLQVEGQRSQGIGARYG